MDGCVEHRCRTMLVDAEVPPVLRVVEDHSLAIYSVEAERHQITLFRLASQHAVEAKRHPRLIIELPSVSAT